MAFGLAMSFLLLGCSEETRDRIQEAAGQRSPSLTFAPSVSLSNRPTLSPRPTPSREDRPTSTEPAETPSETSAAEPPEEQQAEPSTPADQGTGLAQPSPVATQEEAGSPWWPVVLFVAILGGVGAGVWISARRRHDGDAAGPSR